eukprot:gene25617-31321_t
MSQVIVDSLDMLSGCIDAYGAETMLPHISATFPSACAALGPEFPDRLISAVDGEKDPRCLLLAFQLWQALPLVFQPAARSGGGGDLRHLEEHAEELCDVMACYFPIVFTAPPGDKRGVTREMLQQGDTPPAGGPGSVLGEPRFFSGEMMNATAKQA